MEKMPIYRRVFAYYRPFIRPTVIACGLTLLSICCNLLKPWPFAFIVDHILKAVGGPKLMPLGIDLSPLGVPGTIAVLCGSMVLLHLAAGWINLQANLLFMQASLQALLKLRTELYACLHSLPLKFHDARRSADSSFRVAYDSQSIQTLYSKAIFLFQSTVTLAGTFLTMWSIDWQLTGLALLVIPLIIVVIHSFANKIRAQAMMIAERESAVLQQAQEGLSSIKMVQAFNREDFEVSQFHTNARESLEAKVVETNMSMLSALLVSTCIALSTAAMYWVGSIHVLEGTLTVGNLLWMSTLLLMLYQPLEALTHLIWAMEGGAASAQRCFEVLDSENDVVDAPDAKVLKDIKGEVTFDAVAFGYEVTRPIFRNVRLTVAPGTTVAFVGGTGAGKSTLLSLVPRFYDPTEGRVLVDDEDVRMVTKRSLREHISLVLQDTLLFSTTIRENIAYGRPDASDEEIVEAAKKAQAHDFIMEMQEGYRSQVGERGGRLSVGQRQRIGIARAFLKNAPILILDEPTSALDPRTESAIMETIAELMKGRTTLLITHRIATVHKLDQIVVLGEGGVIEMGTGPELMAQNGFFASLARAAGKEG